MTAKELLRQMNELLVAKFEEYDRNQFSDEYWAIHEEYERVKGQWRAAKANGR